ncbi:hypothetical protein ScPMuIL_011826 [Solemya velum]
MASLLCVKQLGGSVKIHNNSDEIINLLQNNEDDNENTFFRNVSRRSTRPATVPGSQSQRNVKMDSKSLIGQTMKIQDWLNEKTIKGVQVRSDTDAREARRLYNPLLETESTFVQEVEDFLQNKEVLDLRKKEMLHKQWHNRVHQPIRKKIVEAMDSYNWSELDRRKRELHKQYLEFVNQKGHVFLDTIDPEEYYAQALNGERPAPIRIETACLRDPLLSQGRERTEEERAILRCMTGYRFSDRDIEQVKLPPLPMVPLGRHGTDSKSWLEMPYTNIESTPRRASRRRMQGSFNNTEINFEQWSKSHYDFNFVDKELSIQKKRMFENKPPPPEICLEEPDFQVHSTPRQSLGTMELAVPSMSTVPDLLTVQAWV